MSSNNEMSSNNKMSSNSSTLSALAPEFDETDPGALVRMYGLPPAPAGFTPTAKALELAQRAGPGSVAGSSVASSVAGDEFNKRRKMVHKGMRIADKRRYGAAGLAAYKRGGPWKNFDWIFIVTNLTMSWKRASDKSKISACLAIALEAKDAISKDELRAAIAMRKAWVAEMRKHKRSRSTGPLPKFWESWTDKAAATAYATSRAAHVASFSRPAMGGGGGR